MKAFLVWGWAVLWGGLICISVSASALAQNVEDYIRVVPAPDWVETVEAPIVRAENGQDRIYALVDYQNRHGPETDIYHSHFVTDLLSAVAVEAEGTISIDFDPLYETITLQRVDIIRNGRRIDAIDFEEAMVFRTETDRDQMIFNGTLTFSMPVLDLRVGDRLAYAYTREGRNPAIGEHFLSRRSFDTSTDIKRLHFIVSVHEDVPLYSKRINNPPRPKESKAGAWRQFRWDRPDPAVTDYDDDVPAWSYTRPTYEMSSLRRWDDVGPLFQDQYVVTDADRQAVAPIVAQIKVEHRDAKTRARAALDWVQNNIRYVGLELGEGGFVPRRPERVLRRRFGDCKDVTLLLLSLLDSLDVEADPILVNLSERGGEFDGLPHPYAFDHILVVAEIGRSIYPLDATRDPQMGTLDTMEMGSVRRGLRMSETRSRVIDLPASDYEYREYFHETFDLVSDPKKIGYAFRLVEYGRDADATRNWLARSGREAVQQSYVDYLRDIYATLSVVEPLEISFDEAEAKAVTTLRFEIPRPRKMESIETRMYQILGAMPGFEGEDRRSPFAITHPRHIRQVREYRVSDAFSFDNKTDVFETEAFRFDYSDRYRNGTFTEDYRWKTKSDHITVKDFKKSMQDIETIRERGYSEISLP